MSDPTTDNRADRIVRRLGELVASSTEVRITRDRYGYRIDGEFYRRVTTLLRGIPKPWLGTWAAKMVADFAVHNVELIRGLVEQGKATDAVKLLKGAPWSKRDDAGDRGTAIHNAIEAFVAGQDEGLPDTLTDDERACAERATAFLDARPHRILAAEMTVYHPTLGYAGTLDLWSVSEDGTLWIDDWKTSRGIYAEHAVQQVAYRRASHAIVRKRPVAGNDESWTGSVIPWGPHMADRLGIVHVTPEAARLHPINMAEEDRLWRVFRAAAGVEMWQSDTDDFGGKTPKARIYDDPNGDDQ